MSREIKFRAWDYVLKEMSVPFHPYYAREFMPPPLLEYCGQDIELLEFTGLQDKNGKDIYEEHELNNKYGVKFEDGCYILYNISNGDRFMNLNEAVIDEYKLKITREYTQVEKN